MKPSALTLPGYKINEYLVVLNPHEELRNKIKDAKETDKPASNATRKESLMIDFWK